MTDNTTNGSTVSKTDDPEYLSKQYDRLVSEQHMLMTNVRGIPSQALQIVSASITAAGAAFALGQLFKSPLIPIIGAWFVLALGTIQLFYLACRQERDDTKVGQVDSFLKKFYEKSKLPESGWGIKRRDMFPDRPWQTLFKRDSQYNKLSSLEGLTAIAGYGPMISSQLLLWIAAAGIAYVGLTEYSIPPFIDGLMIFLTVVSFLHIVATGLVISHPRDLQGEDKV